MNSSIRTEDSPWLVISKPNHRARLRLFCFPYAGGSAQIYRSWIESLPDIVEICAIEIPGRGRRLREKAHIEVFALIADLYPALAPYFDRPFVFFGHSMGALISFELARLLRQEGKPGPAHLFLSARRAPHIPDIELPTYNLPEDEFITELRRLNGTPKEVLEHQELLQLMMPILRADFSVCQTYKYLPQPPLECGITVYGGLEDTDITGEHLNAWGEQTKGPFIVHMLAGDHFFLHSSHRALLQLFKKELNSLISRIILQG